MFKWEIIIKSLSLLSFCFFALSHPASASEKPEIFVQMVKESII